MTMMPPAIRYLLHVSSVPPPEKIASTVHTGILENLEIYLWRPKLYVAYSAVKVRYPVAHPCRHMFQVDCM